MPEIFNSSFYGNKIGSWALAFGLMLACLTTGRIAYWILGRYLEKIQNNTKKRWDIVLAKFLRLPISIGLILFGIRLCINILTLNETFELWVNRIYHVLFVTNVAWVIARITDSFFVEFLIPISHKATSDLNDMIIPFLRKGTKFIIWTIGIIIGLNNAGYDVGALIAGLGIGGVAVALAARNTISNVFGGVTIFIDQPFRIGDKIRVISRVRGIEGKVLDVGLRLTTLESSDGSVILVPNATFAVDPVENKSKEPSKKITTYLKLHKNNPSEKIQLAIDLLTEMVNKNEDLVSTPIVTFDSIEDMYLGILFIYFIDKEKDSGLVQSKLNMKIIEDFEKNEIKFAQNITSPTEYDPD